jgi:transcriptional regulator with XRE-family HTH domain
VEPDAVVLERKIIGVLIRAAREREHRTSKEVALRLGISQARLRQYEMGGREISLPELENLACFLEVPTSFFLNDETLARREPAVPPAEEEVRARRGLIATKVKQARLDAHKSEQECAQAIGRTVARQKRYEAAQIDIPITDLERLARFLNVGMNYFLRDGLALKAGGELPDPELWCRLPPEIRALIMDQNSLPFLRIAAKLRDLPPSKLQELGEILLVVR